MKTCSKCQVEKPLEDFYFVRRTQARTAACKRCTCEGAKKWREANPQLFRDAIRKNQLLKKYGVTVEEYETIRESQGGGCALCGATPAGNLHVDHDHETGRVRGLLCRPCNTGLGLLRESAELLLKAAAYITAAQEANTR